MGVRACCAFPGDVAARQLGRTAGETVGTQTPASGKKIRLGWLPRAPLLTYPPCHPRVTCSYHLFAEEEEQEGETTCSYLLTSAATGRLLHSVPLQNDQ